MKKTDMDKGETLVKINTDSILSDIADGVVVIGLDHTVLFVNRAAREILGGVENDELICGKKCGEVIGHSACSLGCLINSTIKSGEHIYNYEAILEKGGQEGHSEHKHLAPEG